MTATAYIAGYRWTIDGPEHASLDASRPGSEDDPAATYTFRHRGDYTITESVTWAGSFTWSSAAAGGSGQLAPVTLDSPARDYHVREERGIPVAD